MRKRYLTFALVATATTAGCDSERTPATPAAYEQAKADCAEHGGLVNVVHVFALLRANRTEATCADGVRISREFLSPPKVEKP